jgi:beta-glucosidase
MDASLSIDARLDDLVSRMTLEEKVAVLSTMKGFNAYEIRDGEVYPSKELKERYAKFPGCGLFSFFRADWYSGRNWSNGLTPEKMIAAHNAVQRYAVENTRLGIPLEICGCHFLGETTVPSGLGCAAMFDREALAAGTAMRLRERRTYSRSWYIGHPTADLALDPRWSRVEQTFGEDPFLSAEINYARCRTAREMGAGASMAHFIAHGAGEGGRMSMPVHAGDNEILNLHMRPFEYAVKGGATGMMTCYNLVDGIPGVLRGDLVNGFLRGKLGYKGTFTADAGAIGALVWQGFAKDLGEAAAMAVKNGNDLCCWEAENYLSGLMLALERRLIDDEDIDRPVRRVLERKFRKGLFERPYIDEEWRASYGRPESVIGCRSHRDIALDLARKAMTLLENPRGVLPLDAAKIHRLAVIGPNADKPANQLGDYTAPQRPGQTVTPRMGFEALGKRLGFEVSYAKGCAVRSMDKSGFVEAIAAAKDADAVVLCLGGCSVADKPLSQNDAGTAVAGAADGGDTPDKDAGEGFDRATLRLGGVQMELLREIRRLGKPVVTVLIIGRPIVLDEVAANSDALLLAWYPGCEGGTAIAETVFGLNNPGGKLPVSFPRSEGAIPCYYHALTPRGNYVEMPCSPLYPFGYGLSYTRFEISKPALDGNTVRVTVKNAGTVAGDDVVQMYLRDVVASVARPRWELKGFLRVSLSPGETKEVAFTLTDKELGYWNREMEYIVEDGEFLVAVSDRFEPDTWLDGDTPTDKVVVYSLNDTNSQ